MKALALRSLAALRRRPTLLPILFSIVMFWAAFASGIASGVSGSASRLMSYIYGATAALSSQVLDLKGHPYSGYKVVERRLFDALLGDPEKLATRLTSNAKSYSDNFRDTALLNSTLKAAASSDELCGSPLLLSPHNDQGMTEFIQASFFLFGVDVRSTYLLYFALLGSSVLLYLIAFRGSAPACAALFACLAAVTAFMPFIAANPELLTVANQRYISTLGIIPLLHILLTIGTDRGRLSRVDLAALVLQSLILYVAYAIRSTSLWMFLAAGIVAVICASYQWRSRFSRATPVRSLALAAANPTAIFLVLLSSAMALTEIRAQFMEPPCGTNLNSHQIWDSVFYGFIYNPDWDTRFGPYYENATGDNLTYVAARKYVEAHGLPYQTKPDIWVITPQSYKTTSEPEPFGSWQIYDQVMKKLTIEFIRKHPRYALKSFLVYRPLLLWDSLWKFVRVLALDQPPWQVALLLAAMSGMAGLGIFAPGRVSAEAGPRYYGTVAGLLVLCLLVACTPFVVFSAAYSLVEDPGYLVIALGVYLPLWLVAAIGSRGWGSTEFRVRGI